MRKLIIVGFYLFSVLIIFIACQNAESLEQAKFYSNGRDIYIKKCQNCHGKDGEGLDNLFPPLTDTLFLKNHRNQLPEIIKNGIEGALTINGTVYNGKMGGFPEMTDIDIAQVLVYVTNSFGNNQGMYPHQEVYKNLQKTE